MPRQRLDILLAERGLFPSRSRAAASVMAGEIIIGRGRRRAEKPGEMIDAAAEVSVAERPRFVSRGGVKLENALIASGLSVAGRRAIDVGASSGGFTDCLLAHGVLQVIAVDVGYGELDYRLRNDPRVSVLERTNARALTSQMLPYTPDLATIDVSFISLAKVLPAVLGCMAESYDVLAMVKPQFEVGRTIASRGRGVVRDPKDRRAALVGVGEAALGLGASVLGYYSSGLAGPKGNKETFVWLAEPGRGSGSSIGGTAGVQDVEQMARKIEP